MTHGVHRAGVLLDVDGTLLDSNDAHAHAWVSTFREEGIDVTFDRVRPLIGKGGDKVLRELANIDDESELGKRLKARRSAIFKEKHLATCRPFPKARELVEKLNADKLRVVVATSASAQEVHALLEAAHVDDVIDHATTSDDAQRSKPDPDIVEAAMHRARLPPDKLVMLGDTPYDIEAAMRARVATIALRSGGWKDDDLRGATAIYDDVEDLLAHYDESPLAAFRP